MKKILFAVCLSILFIVGSSCSSTEHEFYSTLYGTVTDNITGNPVNAATIILSPGGKTTISGSDGKYEFTDLDVMQYTVTVQKDGYLTNRKTVNAVLKIRQKLQGLAFLSSSILPVIAFIDKVLCEMPSEGYFSGEPFWKLAALVKTLGDAMLLEEVMNDPAYAQASFPVEEAESSRGETSLDLDAPQPDANPHLPFEDSNESVNLAQQDSPSESLDLRGFAEGAQAEQDLFRDLDELFEMPNSQGKLSSENATTTPFEGDLVVKTEEKTTGFQKPVSHEHLTDTPVTVPAVDVGEGLYF